MINFGNILTYNLCQKYHVGRKANRGVSTEKSANISFCALENLLKPLGWQRRFAVVLREST